jgi:thermitase
MLSGLMRAAAAAPAAPASATSGVVAGQALVRFRAGTAAAVEQLAHVRAGAHVVRTIGTGYRHVMFPTQVPLRTVLDAYRADPAVAVAEPNLIARLALTPNDPCVAGPCAGSPRSYHLDLTNAAPGWSVYPGTFYTATTKLNAGSVTIAVLDTKVDLGNPDFANAGGTSSNAAQGGQIDTSGARDWIPSSAQGGSAAYHGTYVAGIAAAATGNGKDAAGIGYAARILPLTVVDGNGMADAASLADAIVYAWQRGARVINLSLGLTGDSQAVHDAIKKVTSSAGPSLVVAAAGNNTGSAPFYPGSYPESMSVAGTSANDTRATCSNYNANVSVSAPAERVVSLAPMPGELYAAACGTSAATPQVSGLAALLFGQDPARSPATVRKIIERSADDLGPQGRDNNFGWGRINAERALRDGDGSAAVTAVRASIPPATGGSSIITAVASSARGIVRAELRFDSPSSTPLALAASDGAFGGTREALRGAVELPADAPAGAHAVWVRAFDGSAWGAFSVGVVVVDRTSPSLARVAATNGVRAAGRPVDVTFVAADAVSAALAIGIQVYAESPTKKLIYQEVRTGVAGGSQRAVWMPGAELLPGHYQVKVIVADEAGNTSSALVGIVLA